MEEWGAKQEMSMRSGVSARVWGCAFFSSRCDFFHVLNTLADTLGKKSSLSRLYNTKMGRHLPETNLSHCHEQEMISSRVTVCCTDSGEL